MKSRGENNKTNHSVPHLPPLAQVLQQLGTLKPVFTLKHFNSGAINGSRLQKEDINYHLNLDVLHDLAPPVSGNDSGSAHTYICIHTQNK